MPDFPFISDIPYYYAVAPMVQSVTQTLALKASGMSSITLASKVSKQTCLESKKHGIDYC